MDVAQYRFLSEQQMLLVQQKARDMLLTLKEDVQWSNHCHDNAKKMKVNNGADLCSETNVSAKAEYKDISVQVSPKTKPTVQRTSVNRASPALRLPSVFSPRKPAAQSNALADNLQEIKSRLTDLQLTVEELRENKTSGEEKGNVLSSLPEKADNQKILEDYFKIGLGLKYEEAGSEDDVEQALPNQLTFQVPYVLKEQRMLERRRRIQSRNFLNKKQNKHNSDIKKIYSSLSKTGGTKPTSKTKGYEGPKVEQKHSLHHSGSRNVEPIGEDVKAVEKSVQTVDVEKENACLAALNSRLHEIEEREKQLDERLKAVTVSKSYKANLDDFKRNTSENKIRHNSVEQKTTFISEFKIETDPKFRTLESAAAKRDFRNDKTKLYVEQTAVKNLGIYRNLFKATQLQTGNAHFSPCILSERIVDSVLDDCVQDIAEEMNNVSSNLVMDLYCQEFAQS